MRAGCACLALSGALLQEKKSKMPQSSPSDRLSIENEGVGGGAQVDLTSKRSPSVSGVCWRELLV